MNFSASNKKFPIDTCKYKGLCALVIVDCDRAGPAVFENQLKKMTADSHLFDNIQVMAGALSDNNRATIVGERTFGKGLIQTIIPLSGGISLPQHVI